jgi:hypothetical protein
MWSDPTDGPGCDVVGLFVRFGEVLGLRGGKCDGGSSSPTSWRRGDNISRGRWRDGALSDPAHQHPFHPDRRLPRRSNPCALRRPSVQHTHHWRDAFCRGSLGRHLCESWRRRPRSPRNSSRPNQECQNNRPNNTPADPRDVRVSRLPFENFLMNSHQELPNLCLEPIFSQIGRTYTVYEPQVLKLSYGRVAHDLAAIALPDLALNEHRHCCMRYRSSRSVVERTPQSRSDKSAFANSSAKRTARISSRSRNSVSSTGSR